MQSITVRVPATTANLAPGFDVLGCALQLYNTVTFSYADKLSFSGCDSEYQTTDNLAYQGYEAVCKSAGIPTPALHIDIQADIPVCRGLGSSAAMLVAGALAANEMQGTAFSRETLLALTTQIEGHPDNLAPALFGGLTASFLEHEKVYTARYTPHKALRFVALSPDFPLSTHVARSVLPKTIPFADAIYNGAHLAVLLRALENGDEPLIAASLKDRLHQPYRAKLIYEYDAVRALASQNGCDALCISGAGPTLLCLTCDPRFAENMQKSLQSLCHEWKVLDLSVDYAGAQIIY